MIKMLTRGVIPPNKYPVYDTKQFDDQVLVMLGLWGIQNNPSLPSLPVLLWPGLLAPDSVLYMTQTELFYIYTEYKPITYAKFNCLE